MEKVVIQNSGKQFKMIPIELVKSPSQPSREEFEDLKSLSQTIEEHGIIEPLVVRKLQKSYGYEVIAGLRRLEAAKIAKLKFLPCMVVDGISEEQALEMTLIENLQRQDLQVHEEAKIIKTLKERYGLTNAQIGSRIGLSGSQIRDYLLISEKLPEKIIRKVTKTRGGKSHPRDLNLSKAVVLARSCPPHRLREMVELIRTKGMSREKLAENLAATHKQKLRRVHSSRVFWNELVKSLKDYKRYWSEYCQLEEWEDVEAFHLQLKVTLPKDLGEAKV